MPELLFLHDLDEMLSLAQAHAPEGHEAALSLLSPCHPTRGLRIMICAQDEDSPYEIILELRCWTCGTATMAVALTRPLTHPPQLCRHRNAMDVWYREGALTVECWHCKQEHFTMAVAPHVQEIA
jgi:hypothetical protein